MNDTIQDAIELVDVNISIYSFLINLLISAILSIILKYVYEKYGESLSNRSQFAKNFLLLTMTTMLIITVVKSSLALSLGLVGALSIIRFRAAIKEPEELTYLFLSIAVGLGLGANQTKITLIAFFSIVVILLTYKKLTKNKPENTNIHLSVSSENSKKVTFEKILDVISSECEYVDLRRMDENKGLLEISLMVEISSLNKLSLVKNKLLELDKDLKITYLENKGLI